MIGDIDKPKKGWGNKCHNNKVVLKGRRQKC